MAWSTWASTKWPMRALAMTGIDTASMIWWTSSGSLMRATPPWARMSAGTRSRAMTATAPASSAILAWSAVTTSMMTPPLSISARPRLTRAVPVTWLLDSMLEHSSPVLEGPVQRLHFACSGAHFGFRGYTSPRPGFNGAGRLRAGEVAQGPAVQAADHAAGQADHGAVDRVDHHRRPALAEPGQGLLDADGGVHEVAALQPAADPAGGATGRPRAASTIGVRTGPGKTAQTSTPREATSRRRPRESSLTNALVAPYRTRPAMGLKAAVELTLTMAPRPRAAKAPAACLVSVARAATFRATVASAWAGVARTSSPWAETPALLTWPPRAG